jgi:ribosomal protein L37AE/L43A
MGRNKKVDREESYIEQLEKEIRELKSINRSLMRRLKKVDREFRKKGDEVLNNDPEPMVIPKICPECGKGHLKIVSIGIRVCDKCDVCGYASRFRKP